MMGAQPTTDAFEHAKISEFTISGHHPFGTGVELQDDAARGAHALLIWLSNGLLDAESIDGRGGRGGAAMTSTTSRITSDALDGIAMLVALSSYGAELERAEAERDRLRSAVP